MHLALIRQINTSKRFYERTELAVFMLGSHGLPPRIAQMFSAADRLHADRVRRHRLWIVKLRRH